MRVHPDGLELRALFRRRRVYWDDVSAVEGAWLTLSSGERLRAPAPLLSACRQAVQGPEIRSSLPANAAAVVAACAAPFSPRRIASALILAAERMGASDVHLEPAIGVSEIRMRLAGELTPFARIPSDAASRIGAALKGLAGCLAYRRDIVQEGRIAREGVAADVRASFVPTALGERIALRLFGRLRGLGELGASAAAVRELEGVLSCRSGLVLIAGASGAGKTTTIYAALAHVAATREGAHLSLEDPVEQRLRAAGIPVDQLELDPSRALTGESALVAALRQDVDVIAVGEIRMPSEAKLALEAAHTGRLVLGGIHAGSAAEAMQRMLDLGADPRVLRSTARAVVFQQLRSDACACAGKPACPSCAGLGRVRRAELHVHREALALREAA